MHAKAGSRSGVMNHTVSGKDYFNLRFNGTSVGETGIHAALCGTWDCPVLLVTGDDVACAEGRELLGNSLTTVAVKTGLGSTSARQIPPLRARQMIEDGAKQALSDVTAVAPWDPAARARSSSSSSTRSQPTGSASGRESSASTTARSRSPLTPGGRPGRRSTSIVPVTPRTRISRRSSGFGAVGPALNASSGRIPSAMPSAVPGIPRGSSTR